MPKALLVVLAYSAILLVLAPAASGSQSAFRPQDISLPSNLQTKVLVDPTGDLHVLWLVPPVNGSYSPPGIWYSKYSPNGTSTIAPTRITNSTSVQSADLAVDAQGDAVIVWSDDIGTPSMASSVLYLLRFNSTISRRAQILTTKGSLVMWPSVAVDNNGTSHLVWTQYDPTTGDALIEYGTSSTTEFRRAQPIASYSDVRAFPPKVRVVFDQFSNHFHIAWGTTQLGEQYASAVDYAKVVSNGTVVTKLQVAKLDERLRDVSIAGTPGEDGAFVVWQTDASNESVYVSQISGAGKLVYLKELSYPNIQTRYLAVSSDSQDNLYVFWSQPSALNTPPSKTSTPGTNVSYIRINLAGDIVQTGNGVVRGPVIAVTVSTDGDVYAISSTGLVQIVTPPHEIGFEWVAAVALLSCVGFAAPFTIEAGRYRFLSFWSKITPGSSKGAFAQRQDIVQLLARKPGLKLSDIKRLAKHHQVGMTTLTRLEKSGLIASLRDGLSRRFYAKQIIDGSAHTLQTRIMLWIMDHPAIWEAQLSKDLGLSQQIVHYHLKRLRESKLIASTLDSGNRKLYRFTEKTRSQEMRHTPRANLRLRPESR